MHEIIFSPIFKMIHMLSTTTKRNTVHSVALSLLLRDHLLPHHGERQGSELYTCKKGR